MRQASSDPLEQTLQRVVRVLGKRRASYCVIGALALGAWGQPRTTQDLDLLTMLDGVKRSRVLADLQQNRFKLDTEWSKYNPMIRDWHFRLQHHGIPVDLLLPRDAHDLAVLERRRRKTLGSLRLWVISPEDLILHKLKAGRPRDFEDSLSVIIRQGKRLDLKYLNHWGGRLGLQEELTYLLSR